MILNLLIFVFIFVEQPVSEKEKVISEGVMSGQISADLPRLIIIIVSVLGSSLLFLNIILVVCFVRRRRKKRIEDGENLIFFFLFLLDLKNFFLF